MLKKKKVKKVGKIGIANIHSTFNNTIVTICDLLGNTLCWSSSGTAGFKGARKETAFAAQIAARNAGVKAAEFGLEKVVVIIKGRGDGREPALRALKSAGLNIFAICDKIRLPHNGCRPPKRRKL